MPTVVPSPPRAWDPTSTRTVWRWTLPRSYVEVTGGPVRPGASPLRLGQGQCRGDDPPHLLGRLPRLQRLVDRPAAQVGDHLLPGPYPRVRRPEGLLHPRPELGVPHGPTLSLPAHVGSSGREVPSPRNRARTRAR